MTSTRTAEDGLIRSIAFVGLSRAEWSVHRDRQRAERGPGRAAKPARCTRQREEGAQTPAPNSLITVTGLSSAAENYAFTSLQPLLHASVPFLVRIAGSNPLAATLFYAIGLPNVDRGGQRLTVPTLWPLELAQAPAGPPLFSVRAGPVAYARLQAEKCKFLMLHAFGCLIRAQSVRRVTSVQHFVSIESSRSRTLIISAG